MNIENVFPHTLGIFFCLFVIKMNRKRASVIRKMHSKPSKDVSGTFLRGTKPAFVKVLLQISMLRNKHMLL